MSQERGKNIKLALLQISIKNIPSLEEKLAPSEIMDLIDKVYSKIKNIIEDKDAYLYNFIGSNFFIIFNDVEDSKTKIEESFFTSKEILEKLKKHNDFLVMNHIPKLEYSFVLDCGNIISGSDFIIKHLNLEEKIKNADLVISGEGKIDKQSFQGKIVGKIYEITQKYNKKLLIIAGYSDSQPKLDNGKIISLFNHKPTIEIAKKLTPKLIKEMIFLEFV